MTSLHPRDSSGANAGRALVLGGGGVAGVAWEIGVLSGLADAGVDVRDADLVVGTSAGSVVAAQITGGLPLEELHRRQLEPSTEIAVAFDRERMFAEFARIRGSAISAEDAAAKVGALALAAHTPPEAQRRAVIGSRLPSTAWPDRRVIIVAVDASTGKPRFFDRSSGVPLVDAVAASCAVPGVWPPVTIDGRRYIDGGVRSTTNVDVARGHDRILVVAPFPDLPGPWHPPLPEQLAALAPARTHLIAADAASLEAFGSNPLDPATRAPSTRAGRSQGRTIASIVGEFWASQGDG